MRFTNARGVVLLVAVLVVAVAFGVLVGAR